MFYGILGHLTFGQKMKMVEGGGGFPPLDRSDIETFVTRSEERNNKNSRRDQEMTATNGNCTPEEKGYLSFNPRKIPQISVFFQFQSCCCEDSSGVLLELLYQFALQKKLANPNILHVAKKFSPNGACNALHIDAILAHNPVGTRADLDSIAEYYVQLLGF